MPHSDKILIHEILNLQKIHPTNVTQWRNIDSRNPEFVKDLKNIRIVMSTYGMNPFMNNST
jgi:hypothetical protein